MSRKHLEIEELLAALPEKAEFLSTAGQVFVTLPTNQSFPLSSAYVRDWMVNDFLKTHHRPPNEHSVQQAIRSIRTQAHCRGARRRVDVRIVGAQDKTIFIDLANAQGEAVQITPGKWQITKPVETVFQSTRGQLELPHPVSTTTTNGLLTPAVQHWLQTALRPTGPYPILVLHGPPGSGKTTLARMLRALLDPVLGPIQPLPSRGKEILDLATRDRVLVFDHVTRMSNSTADALCQISSGTAIPVKEPGDRAREPLRLDIARPVIITTPRMGLNDWQPREDLAERIIAIEMPKIENPSSAESLWKEFETNRPAILAALYTAMCQSLGKNDEQTTTTDERAALYAASAQSEPIYKAIQALSTTHPAWTGTATDLAQTIQSSLTARSLSHRLHQLQAVLSKQGIELDFHRKHGGARQITIRQKINEEPTMTNDERPGADLRHPALPPPAAPPTPRLPDGPVSLS